MEVEKEMIENVELFWKFFNEIIFKVFNGSCKSFNLIGWCMDMVGVNFVGFVNVFGVDVKK